MSSFRRTSDATQGASRLAHQMTPAKSEASTVTSPPTARAQTAAHQCGCGHLNKAHDKIAARYCAATQTGALTRGCICHHAPAVRTP